MQKYFLRKIGRVCDRTVCVLSILFVLSTCMHGADSFSARKEAAKRVTTDLSAIPLEHLSVDPNQVLASSFMGFGVELDPYSHPPTQQQWEEITSRLDILQPAFFRVMISARVYCQQLDASGCANYVWHDKGQELPNHFQQLLRILDYAQKRGIPVMFGEFHWPALPHAEGVAPILGPDDPRWPEIIAPFLKYLVYEKHFTVLRFYNYMNEPNGGWSWPGGKEHVSYDAWLRGITHARQVFDREGLQSISIVGPDNSGDWNWLDRTAHDAAPVFGGWEMHFYPKDNEITDGDVFQVLNEERKVLLKEDPHIGSKPLFLGESGLVTGKTNGQQPRVRTQRYGVLMADIAAQVAQAGWMGASAWDLDDAMYPGKQTKNGFLMWGFWNIDGSAMGAPEEERTRPWFRVWALLARLFPPGSEIVRVSDPSNTNEVRAVAAKYMHGSQADWGIVLVNDHDEARRVDLGLPRTVASGRWRLYKYFTTLPQKNYEDIEENSELVSTRSGRIEIPLPPQSVAFVSFRHAH